nr:HeH/LEM domain-containing protein [Weissella kandleri]
MADNNQDFHVVTPATNEKEIKINVKAAKEEANADSAKPSDKNTVAEIKAYLDAKGVDYNSSAKKADLLELV